MVGYALDEATGRKHKKRPKNDVAGRAVVVLGSGNLGLIYLMKERRRLSLEAVEANHPELVPALREHPHVPCSPDGGTHSKAAARPRRRRLGRSHPMRVMPCSSRSETHLPRSPAQGRLRGRARRLALGQDDGHVPTFGSRRAPRMTRSGGEHHACSQG
jgi:hypothetical protein